MARRAGWSSGVGPSREPRVPPSGPFMLRSRLDDVFTGSPVAFDLQPSLNLDTELRFHLAKDLHRFVAGLLAGAPPDTLRPLADHLEAEGFHLRLSRDLDTAKGYLRERYAEDRDARFGIVASSKDKDLVRVGVPNGFQDTKRVKLGPWYGDPGGRAKEAQLQTLRTCVTEFGAQGLELDFTLLGLDSRRSSSSRMASGRTQRLVGTD